MQKILQAGLCREIIRRAVKVLITCALIAPIYPNANDGFQLRGSNVEQNDGAVYVEFTFNNESKEAIYFYYDELCPGAFEFSSSLEVYMENNGSRDIVEKLGFIVVPLSRKIVELKKKQSLDCKVRIDDKNYMVNVHSFLLKHSLGFYSSKKSLLESNEDCLHVVIYESSIEKIDFPVRNRSKTINIP